MDIKLSSKSSHSIDSLTFGFYFNLLLICLQIYILVLVSYTPSHPISMKFSFFVMLYLYMSGKADIIYYFYGNFLFFLNYKSPIDLERFKFEFTLP